MIKFKNLTIAALLLTIISPIFADIKLPSVVSDHMVLQQKSITSIWGWAEPDEKIQVKVSWKWFFNYNTTADKQGNWKLAIPTPKAGGPYTITIKGNNTVKLKDILIGEVWICSGQSNMQWTMTRTENAETNIAKANFPKIRLFTVKRATSAKPLDDCTGEWAACTTETVKNFSAAGYYFGMHLQKDINVPIGLISTNWGGTPAQSWTAGPMLKDFPEYAAKVKELKAEDTNLNPHTPSSLYNGMINPLLPYTIKGAIWYQGESNVPKPTEYQTLFPTMIESWRQNWNLGDFPFYYVQIAPFNYKNRGNSEYLREAQTMALSVPNTGMAVISDIGNINNIHPTNKLDVGKRLSLWALAKTYGKNGTVYSGPIYKSMTVEGDNIRLSFDYTGSGLVAKDGPLKLFTIAGEDKNFVEATATIDGNTIIVSSDQVANPAAVRFAFTNTPEPNLFNKQGLPASSFRTDNW